MEAKLRKFLLISIAFIAIIIGCKNKELQNTEKKELTPIKVKVEKIKYETLPVYLTLTGFVKSKDIANVSPKINGYIKKINYNTGDHVKKDAIIAIIENKETEEKLKALINQLSAEKLSLKEAKEMVVINKKSYLQAKSNYEYALKTFKRYKNLLKTESVTKQEFDRVLNQYNNAKLQLEKSKKMLEISRLKVKQAEKMIKSLKSNINSLKVILNYRFVKSPFSGVVIKKFVDTGNFINVGMPILQIGSEDKEGVFYIPSKYINQVKIGDKIIINFRKYSIFNIEPDIDKSSSQFIVKVDLGKNKFVNGEYLTGKFKTGVKEAIVINKKFVKNYEGLNFTYIAKDNFIVKVALKLKKIDDENYEVISGLNSGDLLITSPLNSLKDNYPCEY